MDWKKYKPADIFNFLNELANKIPENIALIIKRIMIGILLVLVVLAARFGYNIGYSTAKQEGQELARDTKSLFQEEIERDYNRKRKNIRMPSSDNLLGDEIYKPVKQYEPYAREGNKGEIVPQETSLIDNERSIRSLKSSGETAPLSEMDTLGFPVERNTNNSDMPIRRTPATDSFDIPGSSDNDSVDFIKDKDLEEKRGRILKKKEKSPFKSNEPAPTGNPEKEEPVKEEKSPVPQKTNRLNLPTREKSGEKKLLPVD